MLKARKKQLIEIIDANEHGLLVQNVGNPKDRWIIPTVVFNETYEYVREEKENEH